MSKFGTSQPVRRLEDARFLTGQGCYIDDAAPEGALFAHVLRSSVAHAEITELDVTEARAAPGVHAVITAADLADRGLRNAIKATRVQNRDGSKGVDAARPILAEGRVRHVGEPVAFIVAETLAQAKDAAELVLFEFDDLDAKTDLAPGGPVLHDAAPENLAYDWAIGDEAATDAALAGAVHRVRMRVSDNRVFAVSMEPRGSYAECDGDRVHIAMSGQGVWELKSRFAKWLGLPPDQVRVTTPDVGGGFGMKGMTYPEEMLVGLAARDLGRPVRWMSERTEAMLSDNAGRDLVSDVEMGFDADHRLVAYKVHTLSNLGAYNSQFAQPIQSRLFSKVLTGVYDVQAAYLGVQGVYTSTTPVDAYRGAGRPEAIYVLERAMDRAARELGVDPLELRRRNFITPAQMPYRTATGELYDVGDFARVLDRAVQEADLAGFDARREAAEAKGALRGLGLCFYIESILGDSDEIAKVELTETGAGVYAGTQSNGQGHETVFAQMLHEQLGLPLDRIELVQGDSDRIAKGGGTGGSRSVTVMGMAIGETTKALIAGLMPVAEEMLEGPPDFDAGEGVFRSPGSNVVVTLQDVAERARASGQGALCTAEQRIELPGRSYPNGCHICEVEIDSATGSVRVDRYTVVDDFGVLMNPMLAEGQVHGGVVQGLGQALSEHVVYDETGQLLSASFMDYGMPRASDAPMIAFYSEPVPSTANPLGMKGCGEAGTVGALAAVGNAVQDALWPLGLRQVDMPFTPLRVWTMLQQGDGAVAAE